jgi:hypothetical protein
MAGRKLDRQYLEEERKGGHICCISNLGKFWTHCLNWRVTTLFDSTPEGMIAWERPRQAAVCT